MDNARWTPRNAGYIAGRWELRASGVVLAAIVLRDGDYHWRVGDHSGMCATYREAQRAARRALRP